MMRTAKWLSVAALSFVSVVFAMNASFLAPQGNGSIKILAHRGVHQQFSRENLANDTCTAAQSLPSGHDYLENSIGSIEAAFDFGADMVEIDIHPTTDGEFAVFHDWTLDCRTNGSGVTREQSMTYLKTLDIGYGYTSDGGRTFPFRGRGVGLMPTLGEVLTAFPENDFLINIKGGKPHEADLLVDHLEQTSPRSGTLILYASPSVAERWRARNTGMGVGNRAEAKACAKAYLLKGWLGFMPSACKEFGIAVPQQLEWVYWGWPHRLLQRARDNDVRVFLAPALGSDTGGIDTVDQAATIPAGFDGHVITNRIEVIGPALKSLPVTENSAPSS